MSADWRDEGGGWYDTVGHKKGTCLAALSGNPVISINGQLDVQQHKRREDRD